MAHFTERMMKYLKRSLILIIVIGALASGIFVARADIRDWWESLGRAPLPVATPYEEVKKDVPPAPTSSGSAEDPIVIPPRDSPTTQPRPVPTEGVTSLPRSVNLGIPFTSQAPLFEWDAIHADACEEASIYMVKQYFDGVSEGPMDAEESEAELLRIVAREMELFGYFESTTAEQTGELAKDLYGLSYELFYNPTKEDLKRFLAHGHPILVPAAGKLLKNPYFTGEGPEYHMLVLRGYTEDGMFITNDPGTRRGEAYLYKEDVLFDAIYDWDPKDVKGTTPVILVLSPTL